jgi:hypothetical protein
MSGYLVDWTRAKALAKKGDVLGPMFDCIDEGGEWAKETELCLSPDFLYFGCADAWEKIRGSADVPRAMDAKAQKFMNHLITFSDYCSDLGPDLECITVSASPASVARFASAANGIDFTAYRAAYSAKVPKQSQESLAYWTSSRSPKASFEKGFIPYVKMWIDILKAANRMKWGVIIHQG